MQNLDLYGGTVDIHYESSESLGGFQFDIDGAEITDVYGGIAAENDFDISFNGTTVLGFSFSGDSIPSGAGIITKVDLNFTGDSLCLANPFISGVVGGLLDVTLGECLFLPQIQLTLGNLNSENNSFAINMNNFNDVNAFQFTLTGVDLSGISGGVLEEYQFDILLDIENGMVQGDSPANGPIPPGEALFTTISYSDVTGTEICLQAVEVFDENSFSYNVDTGDCLALPCGCVDETALNYDENAVCPGECDYEAFEFVGTTLQAFYIIENLTINGEAVTNDLFEIGAFNHDTVCVGSVPWPGHDTTLAVYGNDFITPGSDMNLEPGQIPSFIGFNSETQEFFELEIEECTNLMGQVTECRWYNSGFNSISNLFNAAYSIQYDFSVGNNLFSLPGINPALEGTEGMTDAVTLMNTIDELVGVQFLIGQGVGLFHTGDGPNDWSGNLNDVTPYSGYWINIGSPFQPLVQFENGIQPCETYSTSEGNNLLSFKWGDTNAPTLEALGGTEFASDHFNFIIGQGVGLFKTGDNSWSGNLNNLIEGKGYWVNIADDNFGNTQCEGDSGNEFCWGFDECSSITGLARENNTESDYSYEIPEDLKFVQSTKQAFYLIKDISGISTGDIFLVYCNDRLTGSAIWEGEFTPVPVMGRDLSPQTDGFCEVGDIPEFKLLKANSQQLTSLKHNFPGWSSLGVFIIESLTAKSVDFPAEFVLHPPYPNPFNSVTKISFTIPYDSDLEINIFNTDGRLVKSLLNGFIYAGYYQVNWNTDGLSSGIYFVNLKTDKDSHARKLLFLK